jgi:hypothetical protein
MLTINPVLRIVPAVIAWMWASPGQAAVVTTQCGQLVSNTILTETSASIASPLAFTPVPGAALTGFLPNEVCVKVLFTARTACMKSTATDVCYIRAVVNGIEMSPNAGGTQVIDHESDSRQAHAYEWVLRVDTGPYTVHIDRRVSNGATRFLLDDWTMDIMFLQ